MTQKIACKGKKIGEFSEGRDGRFNPIVFSLKSFIKSLVFYLCRMNLNFKKFGSGAPVIILHGLFGSLDNWQTIAKQLAQTFAVYLLDQRNHGRSPHDDDMDYPTMAKDLKTFMEQRQLEASHLVGHSMGGKTAMQFALNYPQLVNKLVVVDIAPKTYPGQRHEIFQALSEMDLDRLQSRKEADSLMSKRINDFGVRQFLLKNLTRKEGGGFRFKMNLPVIQQHYSDILAAIESSRIFGKPALFIKGGRSTHILPEDVVLIKKLFPNASIETIEKAGHWIHAEAPVAFLKLALGFLGT